MHNEVLQSVQVRASKHTKKQQITRLQDQAHESCAIMYVSDLNVKQKNNHQMNKYTYLLTFIDQGNMGGTAGSTRKRLLSPKRVLVDATTCPSTHTCRHDSS